MLVGFDLKDTKLGQNLCPLYRDCLLYGVSFFERFHCSYRLHTNTLERSQKVPPGGGGGNEVSTKIFKG